MRLVYIAAARIPTEKAHGIQIMQMCSAFARAGHSIELWAAKRANPIREDAFAYYDLPVRFPIRFLRVIAPFSIPFGFGYALFELSFARSVMRAARRGSHDIVFYSRDLLAGGMLARFGYTVFLEIHDIPRRLPLVRWSCTRARGIMAISQGIADELARRGIAPEKITLARDGFDAARFAALPEKGEARRLLGVPEDMRMAVYAGSVQRWKGADVARRAATQCGDDARFYFILGGDIHAADEFRNRSKGNDRIEVRIGRPHGEIALWLRAADVALIPNIATDEISRRFTSPLKLFEAMAAGTPIVASDLPSLREVLDETNSFLVPPDSPEAICQAVRAVFNEPAAAQEKAMRARMRTAEYSWESRARRIISVLESS